MGISRSPKKIFPAGESDSCHGCVMSCWMLDTEGKGVDLGEKLTSANRGKGD